MVVSHFSPDKTIHVNKDVYKDLIKLYPNLIRPDDDICIVNEHDEDNSFHSKLSDKGYVAKNLTYNNMIAYNLPSHNLKPIVNRIAYNNGSKFKGNLYLGIRIIHRFIAEYIEILLQFLMFSGYIITKLNDDGSIMYMILVNRRYVTEFLVKNFISQRIKDEKQTQSKSTEDTTPDRHFKTDINLNELYDTVGTIDEVSREQPYHDEYITVIPGQYIMVNEFPHELIDSIERLPEESETFESPNVDIKEIKLIDYIPEIGT